MSRREPTASPAASPAVSPGWVRAARSTPGLVLLASGGLALGAVGLGRRADSVGGMEASGLATGGAVLLLVAGLVALLGLGSVALRSRPGPSGLLGTVAGVVVLLAGGTTLASLWLPLGVLAAVAGLALMGLGILLSSLPGPATPPPR